jgi:sortase (surface protein transpeptidase)
MKKYLGLVLAITIVAITGFITVVHRSVVPEPEREVVVAVAATASSSMVVKSNLKYNSLIIPSLGINAQIEKVGINDKGNIASPKTFKTVGLYKYGPVPGAPGVAILDGHVNNGLGLKGVFADLEDIEIGNIITIVDEKGKKLDFQVEKIATVDYTTRLDEISFKNSGQSQILLVSCQGNWVKNEKTYDKRLLVLANLI